MGTPANIVHIGGQAVCRSRLVAQGEGSVPTTGRAPYATTAGSSPDGPGHPHVAAQQYYVYTSANMITGTWQPYVKNYATNTTFDYGGRAATLWLDR
jgi:hypothetical protein